ncbi:class I SAM-dependent methyltransferase [Chitinophaga caseinilytica]|uniref:class I SAM-dependent methyltransferase n=1 Tax=Chitinophaga caseinilytica TaxID=2267521 RepID=UPI003C2B1B93
MDFVEQHYWDRSYSAFNYFVADDEITQWLSSVLMADRPPDRKSFEFGCCPGRYMARIGQFGFEVNGRDVSPDIESQNFRAWLEHLKINIGELAKGDALDYARTSNDKYDLVCSFGFIEHFSNYQEVIKLHDRLLKPGGILIISTPNFRGLFQQGLHKWLDNENLSRHNLQSMNPASWKKTLKNLNYKIEYSGYFGNFDFWYDAQKRTLVQAISIITLMKIKRRLKTLLPNCSLYSPYCGIIARKCMTEE